MRPVATKIEDDQDIPSAERRDFSRAPLVLRGFCSIDDKSPIPCCTIDLSFNGARLAANADASIGAKVAFEFDQIGNLVGTVVRVMCDSYAVEFDRTESASALRIINWMICQHGTTCDAATL